MTPNELHTLALTIAPELAIAPLYVTLLPPDYPRPADTLAWAMHGHVDYAIRRHLISLGQWQGPGATICFAEMHADEAMVGVLLHEISHLLPARPVLAVDHEPTPAESARQQSLIEQLAEPTQTTMWDAYPRWFPHHGLTFIRRCLHLHYRASRLGHDVPLPAIQAAGWQYELRGLWVYRNAIGDEPQRMANADFDTINAARVPHELANLWLDEVVGWQRSKHKQAA